MDLEISHIRKSFGGRRVLEDISLAAKPGECIGILGGNGCGKTTLLSILAGTLRADDGSFSWQGKDMFLERELCSRTVGYVPQGTPLFEELSGLDNLLLWYRRSELKKELKEGVLSLLKIEEFYRKPVRKMSGGMKKRLSIGCAVAGKQPVLLMDEPTAALDLVCRDQIWNYLADYRSRGGIVLLVTHDINEIEMCDRCYLLKEGRLVNYLYDGDVHRLAGLL